MWTLAEAFLFLAHEQAFSNGRRHASDASFGHQTLDQDDVVFVDEPICFDQWHQQIWHLDVGAVAGHGMCAAHVP